MRSAIRLAVLVCLSILVRSAFAQENYGFGSPGASGTTPDIDSNQAWIGRPDWRCTLDGDATFTQAFFLLSAAPAATSLGVPIWLDLNALIPLTPGSVAATVITDMNGAANFTAPVPNLPALIGARVYSQGFLFDFDPATGLPAVTPGVEITVTAPPLLAVSTSVAGSADPFYLVDPQSLSLTFSGGNAFTDNIFGEMTSHDAGGNLYVASSISGNLNRVDLTGTTPAFSTVTSFAPMWTANGTIFGTDIDRDNDLLWTLAEIQPGATRELHAIDIDLTSTSYGAIVASTNSIPQPPPGAPVFFDRHSIWDLSHGYDRAALLEAPNGPRMFIVDTDPGSLTFLQVLTTTTIPGSGLFAFDVHYSPDDSILNVLLSPFGPGSSELARYDVAGGFWIDYDPLSIGTAEGVGPRSTPTANLGPVGWGVVVAPDGDTVFTTSTSSGQITRIDFGPGNTWTTTTAAFSPPQIWSIDINDDGTVLAGVSFGLGPGQVIFWDAMTLALIGTVPLPFSTNVYGVNWR